MAIVPTASPPIWSRRGFGLDTFAKVPMHRPSQRPFPMSGKRSGVGFASLSPAERARLLLTCRELFREKVRNDLWRMELR